MSDPEPTEPTEVSVDIDAAPRPRARTAALLVGIVAVLGAAIFAGLSLADERNAPEDPVRAMLEAVERGDVLGVLEQLEPGERDALREPLTELVDELDRLEILEGADLGDLSGIEVEFEELTLASEEVGDGVAAVTITGGRGRYRFDAGELPLGSFVLDLLGEGVDDAESSGEEELASRDDDDIIATVRRGGRWYVSIGYTVAEAARRDAGVAFGDMGTGVSAEGAESPEDAVRELVDAARTLDLRRMIELLPPGELGAVQAYAGLFLPEAEAAASEARGELEIDVPTLELDSETSGDRATVFVREAEFTASAGDDGGMSYADGCLDLALPGAERQRFCEGDDPADLLGGSMFGMFDGIFEGIEPPELSFQDEQPPFGIATVRVDGRWYVSPTRTALDALVETARLFERRDLDEIRRYVEEVFEAIRTGFTRSVETFESCIQAGPDGTEPCEPFGSFAPYPVEGEPVLETTVPEY